MNETPITGGELPGRKERRLRLAEAIELIRLLWTRGARGLRGRVLHARARRRSTTGPTSRCRSTSPPRGPLAAKLAGRVGDGFICTSGKDPQLYATLLDGGRARAPRRPGATTTQIARMIEIKVSYDRDRDARERGVPLVGRAGADAASRRRASRTRWRWSAWPTSTLDRAHTPLHRLRRPGGGRREDRALHRPRLHELVFHFPGDEQQRYIDEFAADVLPLLRDRVPAQVA